MCHKVSGAPAPPQQGSICSKCSKWTSGKGTGVGGGVPWNAAFRLVGRPRPTHLSPIGSLSATAGRGSCEPPPLIKNWCGCRWHPHPTGHRSHRKTKQVGAASPPETGAVAAAVAEADPDHAVAAEGRPGPPNRPTNSQTHAWIRAPQTHARTRAHNVHAYTHMHVHVRTHTSCGVWCRRRRQSSFSDHAAEADRLVLIFFCDL